MYISLVALLRISSDARDHITRMQPKPEFERVKRCFSMASAAILCRGFPHSCTGNAGWRVYRHEGGGLRSQRCGEPGQSTTPAYRTVLALQLTNGAGADPGPARQFLLRQLLLATKLPEAIPVHRHKPPFRPAGGPGRNHPGRCRGEGHGVVMSAHTDLPPPELALVPH